MSELKETRYKLEVGELGSVKEILNKLHYIFSAEAYFLLDTPKEYLSGKLSDIPEDKITKLQSLKVFSDKAEFSAEKIEDSYSYRIISDDETSPATAYTRETSYLLRKSPVNKTIFQSGYSKINNKEYFRFNDDGMPVKVFDRLCGYEKGE